MIYFKLYWAFLKISMLSFGGAYSMWAAIEKELVVNCQQNSTPSIPAEPHICHSQFETMLSLSEILPGPQVNGIAVLASNYGFLGVFAALAALLTPGLFLVPLVVAFHSRFNNSEMLRRFILGAVLVVLSILLLFVIRICENILQNYSLKTALLLAHVAASFWLSYKRKVPPLAVVLGGILVGYVFY